MNTILIFTTRQLCYSSAEFFAARLAESFENLGYEVEMCQVDTDTNTGTGKDTCLTQQEQDSLEQYIGKSYLAVLDFNSRLPRMLMDDGSYYLDHIDASFYNYILDHPLYHHESLSQTLNNYHVILVDQSQCDYVRQYYPHIKSVIWQTLNGSVSVLTRPWEQKRQEVLFMGTYRDPNLYYQQIESSKYCDDMHFMIDLMQQDPTMPIDHALEKVLDSQKIQLSAQEFAKRLNLMHPVELYLRNAWRKAAIDALVANHIPLRIIGEWWDGYNGSISYQGYSKNLVFEKSVTFARSFDQIASSAILLDSSPFFPRGIHDRVYAGMANHTAVLTDDNLVKRDVLKDRVGLYRSNDPKKLVEVAEKMLINPSFTRELVDEAYQYYKTEHTWDSIARNLAEQIFE